LEIQLFKATPYHKAWTNTVLGILLALHCVTGVSRGKDFESVTKQKCYCDTSLLSYLNRATDAQVKCELPFSFEHVLYIVCKRVEGLFCCLAPFQWLLGQCSLLAKSCAAQSQRIMYWGSNNQRL